MSKATHIASVCHAAYAAYCEATGIATHDEYDKLPVRPKDVTDTRETQEGAEKIVLHVRDLVAPAQIDGEEKIEPKEADPRVIYDAANASRNEKEKIEQWVALPVESRMKYYIYAAISKAML